MEKTEILENLQKICDEMLKINKNDKKKLLIYQTISSILKDGDSFFRTCNADTAINIFMDLGYKKEEAKKIFLQILT